jgi:hypothetical protein
MGPTVSVLLHDVPDERDKAELLDVVKKLDPQAASLDEFWISNTAYIGCATVSKEGPRPFLASFDAFDAEEEMSRAALQREFHFMPAAQVTAAALANQAIDHRILADLARFLVKRYRGIIDFGCTLGVTNPIGRLVAIPYTTAWGELASYDVGDATFLKYWFDHPDFHMCK